MTEEEHPVPIEEAILDGIRKLIPEAKSILFVYTRSDNSMVITAESSCSSCMIEDIDKIRQEKIPCRCHEVKELAAIDRKMMN